MKELTDDLKKINEFEKFLEENIVIEFNYEDFSDITKEIIIKNKLHNKTFITNKELLLIENDLEKVVTNLLEENTELINELKELVKNKELIIKEFLSKDKKELELKEEETVGLKEKKCLKLEEEETDGLKESKSQIAPSVKLEYKRKKRKSMNFKSNNRSRRRNKKNL